MYSAIVNNVVTFLGDIPESFKNAAKKLSPEAQQLLMSTGKTDVGFSWPIGVLDFVKASELKMNDLRSKIEARKIGNLKTKLKGFQEKAVMELIEKPNGYLVAPTGSGKTLMAIEIMSKLKQRTLFVTHRVELAKQVAATIFKELGISPGFVGKGERIEGQEVTVAVAQSIVKKPLADRYGCVITDEIHHLPTATAMAILCAYSAKYKYGMTATLARSDDKMKLFPFLLGKHKVEVKTEDALELLNIPLVVPVRTGFTGADKDFCRVNCKIQKDCKTDKEVLDCELFKSRMFVFLCGWVNNSRRNELVCKHAEGLLKAGHHSICILTNRKAHALSIGERLSTQGVSVTICVGKIGKWDMTEFELFGGVLVGTESLMGEGINLPELSALLLASPAGGRVRVRQRAGRLMRGNGTKLLIDYIDSDPYSSRLWWSRSSIYKSMKFGFKDLKEVFV